MRFYGLLVLALLAGLSPLQAAPLAPGVIPEPLKPWADWVLLDHPDRLCPFLYNNAQNRQCAWPGKLELTLDNTRGEFSQRWQIYADSQISLPGDAAHWPQQVSVDGRAVTVSVREGKPYVRLGPGAYRLHGEFDWTRLPESLRVPRDTGLIHLRLNGREVADTELNADGHLWLRKKDSDLSTDNTLENRLEIEVFRRIVDDIPLQVITRIEFNVSGVQRELTLGRALLAGYTPVRLDSRLPAKLEADGQLRVQVRPGRWHIDLTARYPSDITDISLPASEAPWPQQEVWVFDARNQLRLVEAEGLPAIDPRQTNLPQDWRQLPAFRIAAGQALHLKVIRRGDPDPEPDRLALERQLWLDFDGTGYTVKDQINGSMTRGWRLEAQSALNLGRVSVDEQAQFITRLPESQQHGVEVRRGAIALSADSRYETNISQLPAVGWDHDFQQVSATLNLPPGWDLFAATGVDKVPGTWLQRWTLLDLFLVLVMALATGRLFGWGWGVLALISLALLWHEPGAPRYVWLNLLAAIALLRVLPLNRFRQSILWYRNLSVVALILIALPFMIAQVREGLYPQLEMPWKTVQAQPQTFAPPKRVAAYEEKPMLSRSVSAPQKSKIAEQMLDLLDSDSEANLFEQDQRAKDGYSSLTQRYDPKTTMQTGPGLPRWDWKSIPLQWQGPVQRDQELRLYLLSPTVNLALNLARVILLSLLALGLLGLHRKPGGGMGFSDAGTRIPGAQPVAFIALLSLSTALLAFAPHSAQAAFPDAELLQELQTRLLAPPDCLPQCAQSPRMRLSATPEGLSLRIEIHAQEDLAAPLPGQIAHWWPQQVVLDGRPAQGLFRDPDGRLWIDLKKGSHEILLKGTLNARNSVQLPLPLTPHRVDIKTQGWSVEGVHENGVPDQQLQLTRLRTEEASAALATLEPGALPAFVRVERTLHLGLDWLVETRVLNLYPSGSAVVLEIPLLEGESVTSEGVHVNQGRVLVNMRESSYGWQSTLKKTPNLQLSAPDTDAWSEVWRADIGPVWHAQLSGIPVIHHQNRNGQWLPEWRPWPGESVSLAIRRPEGVSGRTLTIDNSMLSIEPGQRATDVSLTLSLRSSQGGQHTLTLPDQAQLMGVMIDGTAQPIRQEGHSVTLPITPGEHAIRLNWREDHGMQALLRTPTIDLGAPSVNAQTHVAIGAERWVLYLGGPRLGPAVLFWGVLLVILLTAFALARIPLTPLKTWQWLLLGIGLSQTPVWLALIVVGWLLALGARAKIKPGIKPLMFNLMQIALATLTLLALAALFVAVQQGLLGMPDMQVAGNGSNAYSLNWFQDRAEPTLPRAWVLSTHLLVYRLLMLAWALWLAFALLRWLHWGWQCYASQGLWRHLEKTPKKRAERTAKQNPAADTTPDKPA